MEAIPRRMKVPALWGWTCIRRMIGANFCQVERIKPVVRSSPWRTSGSQVWRGVRPTLRAIATVIMVMGIG